LLAWGADLGSADSAGRTALHLAATNRVGGAAVIGLLIKARADVNVPDFNGRPALVYAFAHGNGSIMAALGPLFPPGLFRWLPTCSRRPVTHRTARTHTHTQAHTHAGTNDTGASLTNTQTQRSVRCCFGVCAHRTSPPIPSVVSARH
jgi:hypothetical protein